MINRPTDAKSELIRRLKALKLPTGGQWYHAGHAVAKPINPTDDVAILATGNCWIVCQSGHSAKIDKHSGAVLYAVRADLPDKQYTELVKSALRHLPAN